MEHEQSLSFTCMHVYSTGRWLSISENQIPLAMANPSANPNVVWTSTLRLRFATHIGLACSVGCVDFLGKSERIGERKWGSTT